MAEYKCIGCGEKKIGERPCSCPTCGYNLMRYGILYEHKILLSLRRS